MIVDNDLGFVRSTTLLLTARGHSVRGLTCPREALSETDSELPDLLIVDLVMPDLSGLELLDALARRDRSPRSAILVTAHSDLAEDIELREYGISTCLTKPLGLDELLDAVEAAGRARHAEVPAHWRSTRCTHS